MIGWFEWDETLQRLVVVIPPWDCVDAPAIDEATVKLRLKAWDDKVKTLAIKPQTMVKARKAFEMVASWAPEQQLGHAMEILVDLGSNPQKALRDTVDLAVAIAPAFADLKTIGVNVTSAESRLLSAGQLMSPSVLKVYHNDLIARMRERYHDENKVVEPHKTLNNHIQKLESLLAEPKTANAVAQPDAVAVEKMVRNLIRRMLFSLRPPARPVLVQKVQELRNRGSHGLFREVASLLVNSSSAAVIPLALCGSHMSRAIEALTQDPAPIDPPLADWAQWVLDEVETSLDACAAIVYRTTRKYLVSATYAPISPQLAASKALLEQHTVWGAEMRLKMREHWMMGLTRNATPALTLSADPQAPSANDPAYNWSIDRLVRWIDGPVTNKELAVPVLKNPERAIQAEGRLLDADRRGANTYAKQGQKDPFELTEETVTPILWDALIQSAQYLHTDLSGLIDLGKTLGLRKDATPPGSADAMAAAVAAMEIISDTLKGITGSKKMYSLVDAQSRLHDVNEALERLRRAITSAKADADQLLKFGQRLSEQLELEQLTPGRKEGGVIGCPIPQDKWASIRDRFHRRYCSPVQTITIDGKRLLLRSDQALALHVTASSQSGYAFCVSVHLWQRLNQSSSDPFDTADEEAFPRMEEKAWFDTFITCAVLHVPEKK